MKNGGGHFAPKLGGHFELESGGHFKLELGGQYDWNLQLFVLDWHVIRMFLFVFYAYNSNAYYANLIKNLTCQKD
jgi:hypothetical protein